MLESIKAAREYLNKRYSEYYGNSFDEFLNHYNSKNELPAWISVNEELELDQSEEVVLIDPKIGVCLYLLNFYNQDRVLSQISKALAIQSRLLPYKKDEKNGSDPFGTWQIILHWFVESNDQDSWIEIVSRVRSETSRLEEVPIDVIFKGNETWHEACNHHGFPRLLLDTRRLLNKKTYNEVDAWANADSVVIEALNSLENGTFSEEENAYISKLLDWIKSHAERGELVDIQSRLPEEPRRLESINIYNFRNIRKIELPFGRGDNPTSIVIQGPNGSGKSNIVEALSLSLFGTSYRYAEFGIDKNIRSTNKQREYINKYLEYFYGDHGNPKLVVNNNEINLEQRLQKSDSTSDASLIEASILSQENSAKFARMSGAELAGQIVGGFSNVATTAQSFIEEEYARVRDQQKKFLARWHISGNIKRFDTAKLHISKELFSKNFSIDRRLVYWLAGEEFKHVPNLKWIAQLADKAQSWNEQIEELSRKFCSSEDEQYMRGCVESCLNTYNDIADEIKSKLIEMEDICADLPFDFADKIKLLGEWLEVQIKLEQSASTISEINNLLDALKQQEESLKRLANEGKLLTSQLNHIDSISPDFLSVWLNEHPALCPTCDSDLSSRGGFSESVDSLRNRINKEVLDKREEYININNHISRIEEKLQNLGYSTCPIDAENREKFYSLFRVLLKEDKGEIYIADQEIRDSIINAIKKLNELPAFPKIFDATEINSLPSNITYSAREAFSEFQRLSSAPNAWENVRKNVQNKLSEVLGAHLPNTIEAVWREIIHNLTPAAWQYPGNAKLDIETIRNTSQAYVMLSKNEKKVFANYILNSAEIHVLGIAWFFTRYLTQGRFNYSFIIMDDPAQEMDQTSYRDLCRFYERILRLHRFKKIPLNLITLFHQDERALDAARETDGFVYILRWNLNTPILFNNLKINGVEYTPPYPVMFSSPDVTNTL